MCRFDKKKKAIRRGGKKKQKLSEAPTLLPLSGNPDLMKMQTETSPSLHTPPISLRKPVRYMAFVFHLRTGTWQILKSVHAHTRRLNLRFSSGTTWIFHWYLQQIFCTLKCERIDLFLKKKKKKF